jgi:predicted DNA-binding transcriptional regulator AlpA
MATPEDDINIDTFLQDYITRKEVLAILGVSSTTLARLMDTEKQQCPFPGHAIKLGGVKRWRLTDIKEWLAKGGSKPWSNS